MSVLSATNLDAFCAPLLQSGTAKALAAATTLSDDEARGYIASVCNEAHAGLRLLAWAGLRSGQRVLEVGAGGGLLTAYLQSHGVDLVAIEPVAPAFDVTPVLARVVRQAVGVDPQILPIAARDLQRDRNGAFDLIFSVNVIEHFQPMMENLDALAPVMVERGAQVHTCANYHLPYEPHYGIALVPFAPRLTPYLVRRDLRAEAVWRSLNFITASDLRAYAKRQGLEIAFKRGALGEALERLLQEPAFAARHPRLLSRVASALHRIGVTKLLRALPPTIATPMTVLLRRPVA